MKKLVSLLLVAAILCLGGCAFAESTLRGLSDQPMPEGETRTFNPDDLEAPERAIDGDPEPKAAFEEIPEDETKAISSDVVVINGNNYTVLLPEGLCFRFNAPANVVVLTQDLYQQSTLYSVCYQSPSSVNNDFISSGMHFNIYDNARGTDIYLYVCRSQLARLYNDSSTLSDDEANYLANYMLTDKDYMLNCSDIVYGWAGGNVWFVGDRRAYDGRVVLSTFVGGMEVYSYVKATTDADYNNIVDLLNCLTISC